VLNNDIFDFHFQSLSLAHMETVYLALGGNIGNVSATFDFAIQKIVAKIGAIRAESSRYRTEPWGNKNQDHFLNMVLAVDTPLSPDALLANIMDIEKMMGRNRDQDNRNAPRIIDIDILFYGHQIINKDQLVIPHPRLHLRNFVLTPLREIAPEFIHPILHKNMEELFALRSDHSLVQIVE
jgi:2-amino-4-hydroxy-6-hydroxymethyldihydropteridine diphosphokinase